MEQSPARAEAVGAPAADAEGAAAAADDDDDDDAYWGSMIEANTAASIFDADPEHKTAPTPSKTPAAAEIDDSWEARMVAANSAATAFSDDDSRAKELLEAIGFTR